MLSVECSSLVQGFNARIGSGNSPRLLTLSPSSDESKRVAANARSEWCRGVSLLRDVLNPAQRFRAGKIQIASDESRPADGIDLADDVHGRVLWVNAHQHVLQVCPYGTIGAVSEGVILIRRIDPVRPMSVNGDG